MLGAMFPDVLTLVVPDGLATADELLVYRAAGPIQVDAVYAVNNANIATSVNTVQLELGKKAGGTGAFTQIANFDAASGWTADTIRTGAITATVAATKLVSGDALAVKKTLVGTGATSGCSVFVNLLAGHKN